MSLSLPRPPAQYEQHEQAKMRQTLENEDLNNLKRGRDIELAKSRLLITAPNGTRYALQVDNAGNLSTAPA